MQFSSLQTSLICPIFSPCSNYFLAMDNNNLYIKEACLDLKNHSQILLKQFKPHQNGKNQMPQAKFSPNSKLIAIYSKKKALIYDLLGHLKLRIQDSDSELDCVIWSENSLQIIVFFSNIYYCTVYNLSTSEQCLIRNPKINSENGCCFSKGSHRGVFMAILQKHSAKDYIGIYFTKTWELLNHIALDTFDAAKIQFAENGYIVVTQNKINFKVLIVDTFRGVIETYGNKDYVMGVCCSQFSNNSKFLALGAYDNCIHLLNTETWKLIAQIQLTGDIDLQQTLLFKEQDMGKFIPLRGGKFKIHKNLQKKAQQQNYPGISIIEFSPDDQYIAVKINLMTNAIFIYQIRELKLVSVILLNPKNIVRDFKWFQNEKQESTLCIGYGISNLLLWKESMDNGLYQIQIPSPNRANQDTVLKVGRIQMGKHGRMLFYSNSMKMYAYAIKQKYEQQQYH